MGMLERYKKRGGFVQLLNLLETTSAEKREKFMKMISEESPAWDEAIRKRLLSFEKILSWETSILMEFLPQVPVMAIAYASAELPAEKRNAFIKALSFGDQKKVEEILKDAKPKPAEIISSQMKIITELRNQIATGKLKMERIDLNLAIPEDIEELLASNAPPPKREPAPDIDWSQDPGIKTNGAAKTANTPQSTPIVPPSAAASIASANSANMLEELNTLKRKMMQLTQENARLAKEVEDYKNKFATLKAAFQKVA